MTEQAALPDPGPAESRGGEAPDWAQAVIGEPLPRLPDPVTRGGEPAAGCDGISCGQD